MYKPHFLTNSPVQSREKIERRNEMTRKDYVLLADLIIDLRSEDKPYPKDGSTALIRDFVIMEVEVELSKALKSSYKNFDANRWHSYIAERGKERYER
jgi:hypothetical protein